MTSAREAIEEAARVLKNRETSYRQTYGGTGAIGLELAKGWTDLAHVIALVERNEKEVDNGEGNAPRSDT